MHNDAFSWLALIRHACGTRCGDDDPLRVPLWPVFNATVVRCRAIDARLNHIGWQVPVRPTSYGLSRRRRAVIYGVYREGGGRSAPERVLWSPVMAAILLSYNELLRLVDQCQRWLRSALTRLCVDTAMTPSALNTLLEIKRFRFTAAHFIRTDSANLHYRLIPVYIRAQVPSSTILWMPCATN